VLDLLLQVLLERLEVLLVPLVPAEELLQLELQLLVVLPLVDQLVLDNLRPLQRPGVLAL
jgi:hypothetical protein